MPLTRSVSMDTKQSAQIFEGEPTTAQHLLIDFTPGRKDTPEVQARCQQFWLFAQNQPNLEGMMVHPEKNQFTGNSEADIAPESASSGVSNVVESDDGQALNMLVFAKERNLINTLFESKMPQSKCTLGSREYKHSDVIKEPVKTKKKKHVCKCTPCSNPKCGNKKGSAAASDKLTSLRILSRTMNEWDATHPKSTEPPGHPPSLQHCIS